MTKPKPQGASDTPADNAPEAGEHQLDQDRIAQIIQWEKEAEGLVGEADAYRAQAAGAIVAELDSGATERQVAEAIGKSAPHVHFAAVAWRALQDEKQSIPDFNTAYKMAKRPKSEQQPQPTEPENPGQQNTAEENTPFPAWSKQVRELKRLTAEMIDQANPKQIKEMIRILERQMKAACTKEQDFEASPGQVTE